MIIIIKIILSYKGMVEYYIYKQVNWEYTDVAKYFPNSYLRREKEVITCIILERYLWRAHLWSHPENIWKKTCDILLQL